MGSMFEQKAKGQVVIIVGLPAFAGFIAIIMAQLTQWADATSPFFWTGIGGMAFGYTLLVWTKWDQIRRGDFFTWGVSRGSRIRKISYILSYGFMVFGFLLAGLSGRF